MKQRIKQYIADAILLGAGYFIISNHFIYYNKSFHILKKSEPNLQYTFFSLEKKSPENILAIDILRNDGIGDILVEEGLISEDRRWVLEQGYDEDSQ